MPHTTGETPSAPPAEPVAEPTRAARIRRAIADGSYRLDPERLADALLAAGAIDPKRTP